jgi:acetylornithine deacetylase/succinyl-diaminopimelate desuccinylase-like protein
VHPDVRAARAAALAGIPEGLRDLETWLRIPSVSGSAAHRTDVRRAADWVARWLGRLTPRVRVVDVPGGPVVVARLSRGAPPSATPLLVVYGHLDVKPAGAGWHSDPFRPVRRGDRLVARGASDDKGQLFAHLLALRAWCRTGLPGDVLIVVDGAEEIGSPGLGAALSRAGAGFTAGRPTAVLVSDTRAAGAGRPSLTVAQRGMLSLRVTVDSGGPSVHAGRLGGAVVDPALVLARLLARVAREVATLTASCAAAADPRPDHDLASAAGGRALHRDRLVERTTGRGVLTVTAVRCVGGPGAVASRAEARLDVRVPPGVPQARVRAMVGSGLSGGVRAPLRVEVRETGAAPGLCAQLSPPVVAAIRSACRDGYGVPPRTDWSGGSIPALAVLARHFPAQPVLLGTGPADDHAHGPDEYLHVGDWTRAVLTSVSLVHALSMLPSMARAGHCGRRKESVDSTRTVAAPGLSGAPMGRSRRGSPTQRT